VAKLPTNSPSPPIIAEKLLAWVLPANIREQLLGDLYEEFYQMHGQENSKLGPKRWFWRQCICSALFYMWKQKGGLMAFIISILIFLAVTLMGMVLGGQLEIFIDWPSVILIFPPAIAFGIAASSMDAYKNSIRLSFVDQQMVEEKEALGACQFLTVTGNTAVFLGIFTTLIGWVAMASNIDATEFSGVFGPAFAVSVLTLLYGTMMKILCYTAEQKIRFRYVLGKS